MCILCFFSFQISKFIFFSAEHRDLREDGFRLSGGHQPLPYIDENVSLESVAKKKFKVRSYVHVCLIIGS